MPMDVYPLRLYMGNYLDQERALQQALATRKKREDIIENNTPFRCNHCGVEKSSKEFVIQYMDSQLAGKYRYLYECKPCKRERVYKARSGQRMTIEWAISCIYDHLLQGAKKRNIHFGITLQALLSLREKQKWLCYYSSYPMSFEFVGYKGGSWTEKTRMQVSCDRLDNDLWYTLDNIVLCCTFINQMKWTLTESEFYKVCKDIVKNR